MSRIVAIADACTLVTDGTHYTPPDIRSGIPFLTVKDITDEGLDLTGCAFIGPDEYAKAKRANAAPEKGDVLFSKDGTVGKVHVVETEQPFAVLSSIAVLRPKEGVDPSYFGHALRSPAVLRQAIGRKTGSAVRRIILADLKKVCLYLPDLPHQRRVAEVLDAADGLRRNRAAAISQLDVLRRSLFADMFGSFNRPPASWPRKTIGDLCEVKGGKRLPRGSEYSDTPTPFRYIRVTDIRDGSILECNLQFLMPETQRQISRYVVHSGDIVISIAGSIGLVAVVPKSLAGTNLTENAARLTPRQEQEYHPAFLADLLRSDFMQDQIAGHVGQATIGKLALFRIEKLSFALPPFSLQQTFADRIREIGKLKETYQASLSELGALFASLQDRAFKGLL